MNATYTISLNDVEKFNALLRNAQKKAAKLGVEAITASFGTPFQREYNERGIRRFVTLVEVTISGATPKYAGWKLVGVVTPLKVDSGELLPFVTTVPGETVHTNGQARDPLACDHCKVRRDRLESFIVQHDDGSERQVGRSCLKDFLGDDRMSPSGLASLLNTLASISESVNEWSRGPRYFNAESLNLVIATTLAVIRKYPFVTVAEARNSYDQKIPTRTRVGEVMTSFLSRPDATDAAYAHWTTANAGVLDMLPVEADFVTAAQYRDELAVILDTKAEGEPNDYITALQVLSQCGAVNRKALGIAVSAVAFVDRELGRNQDPVKATLSAALKTSQFVGEPKKRMTMDVTFIENRATSTGMTIATFVDAAGNILKCFSHQSLTPGQKVSLKATVVRHDTYNGVNSTIVNRPVVTA